MEKNLYLESTVADLTKVNKELKVSLDHAKKESSQLKSKLKKEFRNKQSDEFKSNGC